RKHQLVADGRRGQVNGPIDAAYRPRGRYQHKVAGGPGVDLKGIVGHVACALFTGKGGLVQTYLLALKASLAVCDHLLLLVQHQYVDVVVLGGSAHKRGEIRLGVAPELAEEELTFNGG